MSSAICQVCSKFERKYTIGKLGSSYCKECKKSMKRGELTIIETKKDQPLPVGQPVMDAVAIQQTQVQGQPVLNPYPNQFVNTTTTVTYPAQVQYQQPQQYQQFQQYPANNGQFYNAYPYQQ